MVTVVEHIELYPIPDFPNYLISRKGQVYSVERTDRRNIYHKACWLKIRMDTGHPRVILAKDGKKYARNVRNLMRNMDFDFVVPVKTVSVDQHELAAINEFSTPTLS